MGRTPVPKGSTRLFDAERRRSGRRLEEPDELVVEAPLEIRFEGRPFTVLMRTPGHDEELVRGFLFGEGIVSRAEQIVGMARPRELLPEECENLIEVRLAGELAGSVGERSFYASASCGVCGKTSIADLVVRAPAVASELRIEGAVLAQLPARLRREQAVFERTGGLHAAGLFGADGVRIAVREDIGRHNAVDKLVGWALGEGRLPLAEAVLVVSGRLGYEIVQKAIVAGIPLIGSVGAASSLAVELAQSHGLTLATFLGPDRMNLYGARARVL